MHYQHKIKCLNCSLHFIVCSDYKEWPNHDFNTRTNSIFCPECGKDARRLVWEPVKTDGMIDHSVPGNALLNLSPMTKL